MLFDSSQFFLFFVIVYLVYLGLGHRNQNRFLVAASYFFYGFWSWKFLALMVCTQVVDYRISRAMEVSSDKARRRLLWLSVFINMGTLGFFKYFNFFTENLQHGLSLLGLPVSNVTLSIVLPVGISFYTIQELTYIIDIYKRQTQPARNFIDFALFISYFPQLVAGPIERAERLMPQVQSPRIIRRNDLYEGGWLIFWGLYKKAFVADRLAYMVDPVFARPEDFSGPHLAVAALAFTFQIYADFSGYSDMAVGLGRVMGLRLMYNFNLPFFATSPSDFWRRWHISLSQALRDNLYIPLGGNRRGRGRELMAIMITMLIGGLWHGAKWHFVVWGGYCGFLLIAERLWRRQLKDKSRAGGPVMRWLAVAFMFLLTVIGFTIFRAESMADVRTFTSGMLKTWNNVAGIVEPLREFIICTALMVVYQVAHSVSDDRFVIFQAPAPVRAGVYVLMYFLLTLGAPHEARNFIYFQF